MREEDTIWSKQPSQSGTGVPEVQVVPGQKAGGEVGLPDHRFNWSSTKVCYCQLLWRLLKNMDRRGEAIGF